jgi:hypothetical protein
MTPKLSSLNNFWIIETKTMNQGSAVNAKNAPNFVLYHMTSTPQKWNDPLNGIQFATTSRKKFF